MGRWAPWLLAAGAAACGPRELVLSAADGTTRAGAAVLHAASTLERDGAHAGAPELRTAVDVRNAGADTLWLSHGACAVDVGLVSARRSPRDGTAAWRPLPPGGERVCFLYASVTALPTGAYPIVAEVRVRVSRAPRFDAADTVIRVPAGALSIRRRLR